MGLEPGDHHFTSGQESLRYSVAGSGPLLIVQPPGWGIGADLYRETLKPLEEIATVVFLQPRGAAGTGPTPGGDLNVPSFVQDLEQLRVHLGANEFHLLGHSHGGLIALHYAQLYPDRLSSLILLSPQLVGLPPVPAPADGEEEPDLAPPPPEVVEAMAYLQSVGGFRAMLALTSDEDATEFLRRVCPIYFRDMSNAGPLGSALASHALPIRTLQSVSSTDESYPLDVERLSALPMPVLVVAGAHDRVLLVPSRRQLASMLPRGQLLLFEESGHFPWLEEAPKFFPKVREFLAGASQPTVQPSP
jgi:pimeloyl-ACP methyl ester carboxylesterase